MTALEKRLRDCEAGFAHLYEMKRLGFNVDERLHRLATRREWVRKKLFGAKQRALFPR